MKKIKFKNMAVLDMKETDIIVIQIKDHITKAQAAAINEQVKKIGIKNEVMVLDGDAEIALLREEKGE